MSAGARLGHSDFVLIIFPVIAPILFNILCCAFYARPPIVFTICSIGGFHALRVDEFGRQCDPVSGGAPGEAVDWGSDGY
jgi:hypothetical protein